MGGSEVVIIKSLENESEEINKASLKQSSYVSTAEELIRGHLHMHIL